MAVLRDATLLTPGQRERASLRFKALRKIDDPPELTWFNFGPCPKHAPDHHPLCSRCGIIPRNHQWVGALWMYAGIPDLLSDSVGLGKTATTLMMLAMCKQAGELSYGNRALIVCQPSAMHDPWSKDLGRLLPGLDVIYADGSPAQRRKAYEGQWEIAVVSSRTFAPARGSKRSRPGDVDILIEQPVGILVCDDVDELRSPGTRTFRAVNRMAAAPKVTRVHMLHATPLQKRVMELWAYLVAVNGIARLGSEAYCRQRYVTQVRKVIVVPDRSDPTGRRRTRMTVWVDSGMTRRPELVTEFRAKIAPLFLRRTARDLDDVTLPEVQLNQIWLDLLPAQRRRYEELRAGVLRRLRAGGEEVTFAVAAAAFTRGQQICGGLASLDEGPESPGSSVKLDWAMDALTGDLSEEKVICFVHHRGNVRALSQRLARERIGHVLVWGEMTDKKRRAERMRLFREDDRARVLVGSLSIKKSLNLQVARHMIGVDTILNPAGMDQLIGRMRRQGNPYPMVFFHQLLALNTQETAYPALLNREQEVQDLVWDETSDIRWVLSPRQLMRMVAEGRVGERTLRGGEGDHRGR